MTTLKIEMIHDIVCSWCPIGFHNMRQALLQLKDEVTVDFRFLPYELNPNMPQAGEDIIEHLMQRNNWSRGQVMAYRKTLLPIASAAGVEIDFSRRTHYYNSFKAHCLLHFAEQQNRHLQLNEIFIQSYHSMGLDISNENLLLDLAQEAQLNPVDAARALHSSKTVSQVRNKLARVRKWGTASVPSFVIDDKQLITGSNSAAYFVETIRDFIGIGSVGGRINTQTAA